MKEPQIIISLKEYEEIKDIKNNFQKAFNEKKTIIFHDSYFPGHSGYPVHEFAIVNTDTFMNDLIEKIKRMDEEYTKVCYELYELKNKQRQ